MDYRTIDVTPCTPVIGADIGGVDLTRTLPDEQWREIHDVFLRHSVIFFRDQQALAPAQQIAFARRFGGLHIHPAAPHLEGHPEVFVIHAHKDSKIANGEFWHSDVSCDVEPPLGSILQIHTLPPSGGDTLFASMYAAYDDLSPRMKGLLEGLTAVHESEHFYRGRYADRGVNDAGKVYPTATHPVVRAHPETGKPCLFVNRTFTTRIEGLADAESRAILDFLFQHMESPYYQTRFHWRRNDVAMWDNRCTQHMAIWDYWPYERKGNRVTVKGDRPRAYSLPDARLGIPLREARGAAV
jgi:taurine dioxygenase